MKIQVIILLIIAFYPYFTSIAQHPPDGAAHKASGTFLKQAPVGNYWVQARCDVATIKKGDVNDGIIEIDFLEVIQENLVTGEVTTLTREDYNIDGYQPNTFEAGLYTRNPWFVKNDSPRKLINSIQTGRSLRIRVGEYPDLISHFWTKCIQGDYNTRHKVRVRFRVTGEIGFQFGLDYSPTSNCGDSVHTEAFVSRWYYDTNGGFITETIPDYDINMFGREHYGVYSDGTFFISKQLVEHRQGKSVKLVTEQNGWKQEEMELIGNKFQFKINKNLSGRIKYCFRIDGLHYYIPHAVENDLIYWDEDVVKNKDKGYDFFTEAMPSSVIEN